jgi:hypothetical protein
VSYEPKIYKLIATCIGKSGCDFLYKVTCNGNEICYKTAYPLKTAAETLMSWRHNANVEDIVTLQHGDDPKTPITIKTTVGRALEIRNFFDDLAMAAGKNRS